MNEHEFEELSAGHALHALSPEDERAYREALDAHPEWMAVADLDAATAAALAEGAGTVAPPLDARSRLLSAIAKTPQAPVAGGAVPADAVSVDAVEVPAVADPPEESAVDEASPGDEIPATPPPSTEMVQTVQRRNWSRGLFALVASMALLVGIGWGVGAVSHLWATPPAVTALAEIEAAPDAASATTDFDGGTATVHWSAEVGKVVLVTDGLPTIEDQQTFEMWVVRGDDAIPAGTFDAAGGDGTAIVEGSVQPGDQIAVTVEQNGGSPTGTPTTDPLFAVGTT